MCPSDWWRGFLNSNPNKVRFGSSSVTISDYLMYRITCSAIRGMRSDYFTVPLDLKFCVSLVGTISKIVQSEANPLLNR